MTTNMTRWHPFREFEELQARLNRLFNDTPTVRTDEPFFFADWAPAVDIQETDKEYTVKADLPDVKKDDVKVELNAGVLTIEGERKHEKEEKGKKFHRTEREYGQFVRRFALPAEVDSAGVQAEFKDGVLNVRVPKSAMAMPKSIEIKVA
jgi:HSP20 family protein